MSEPEMHEAIAALRREIARLEEPDSRARLDALGDALAERYAREAAGNDGTTNDSMANDTVASDSAARTDKPSGEATRSDEAEPLDSAMLEMVQRYESRHPQVTLLLNDIATRLASMGI